MRTVLVLSLATPILMALAYGAGRSMAKEDPAPPVPSAEPHAAASPEAALTSRASSRKPSGLLRAAKAAQRAEAASNVGDPARELDEPTAADDVDPSEELTDEQVAVQEKKLLGELYQTLENRFQGQAVDSSFRRATETRLRDAVSGLSTLEGLASAQLTVESMDCRSDTCKTTLRHRTAALGPEAIQAFIVRSGTGLEQHFRYEEGRTTVYTVRQK
jgi:hypothetical protein